MSKIKLFDISVDNAKKYALHQIFHSHFWASSSGISNLKKSEDNFCKYECSKSCIAVNTGTSVLNLTLSVYHIKNNWSNF